MDAVRPVDVVRFGTSEMAKDYVAVEQALEIRLNAMPFSVIMRTPGSDRELALGFLFSEGLIRSPHDIERIECDEATSLVNVVFVRSRGDAVAAALAERRQVTMNSSCGLCGRRALESLTAAAPTARIEWSVDPETIHGLPDTLRSAQPAFARTGGLHAAACVDVRGSLEASAEDVGRHNAVDKLIGRMLDRARVPLTQSLLIVSGRASFEIVQKAWLGGIPLVAAVSAPSSLAIELAQAAGITLVGFVREGRFNIYSHPERISFGSQGSIGSHDLSDL
jgi:FdhD protein